VTPVRLRPATEADIPFVMATERRPGYDALVGRWDASRHRAEMALPSSAYLIGLGEGDAKGFAILRDLGDPSGNVALKRIALAEPGRGFGRAFLAAIAAWTFDRPLSHRLWLDVFIDNERARRAYRAAGFREDGLLREAYLRPDGGRVTQVLMSILRTEWDTGAPAGCSGPRRPSRTRKGTLAGSNGCA
jgi:RimJ/RimL family protein N-acetyltransferase